MNANQAYTLDSLFGPPSEIVVVSDFIESSTNNYYATHAQSTSQDIANQCSVDDIRHASQETWSNPTLSAYLTKEHDHTVTTLHTVNQKVVKSTRRIHFPDRDTRRSEVEGLQKTLEANTLQSFRLNTDAVLLMRTPKNSDQNTLRKIKPTPNSNKTPEERDAILLISIHDKVCWGPSYVTQTSQYAFLASQTLDNVYSAIPCISKELLPDGASPDQVDCAVCIENIVYGNSRTDGQDYADKLIKQLEVSSKKGSKVVKKASTAMSETKLSMLSLRVNEPYWLIHHGACEHFFVVDQIRLLHPLDPPMGYPIAIQRTPEILDQCRACAKAPAVWSIVGDIRLGESPCLLCGPCWNYMGPSDDKDVVVLRLPEYIN